MAFAAKYLYIAAMDVDPDHEDIFNRIYDEEHVPNVLKVPGVQSGTRFRLRPAEVVSGGRRQSLELPLTGQPTYQTIWELERPEVLVSSEWARAGGLGEWPTAVRPHLTNLRRVLLERI